MFYIGNLGTMVENTQNLNKNETSGQETGVSKEISQTKTELVNVTSSFVDSYNKLPWEKQFQARVYAKNSIQPRVWAWFRAYYNLTSWSIVLKDEASPVDEEEKFENGKMEALKRRLKRPENVWLFSGD